jgi:hypothetical protein
LFNDDGPTTLLREVLFPFRVVKALGCLSPNGMPCSASPEDDFERNGGVASDICGDAFISGLGRAERGVVDELRDFVLVGTSLSPMEFTLGNLLPWVSSMIFNAIS